MKPIIFNDITIYVEWQSDTHKMHKLIFFYSDNRQTKRQITNKRQTLYSQNNFPEFVFDLMHKNGFIFSKITRQKLTEINPGNTCIVYVSSECSEINGKLPLNMPNMDVHICL